MEIETRRFTTSAGIALAAAVATVVWASIVGAIIAVVA